MAPSLGVSRLEMGQNQMPLPLCRRFRDRKHNGSTMTIVMGCRRMALLLFTVSDMGTLSLC